MEKLKLRHYFALFGIGIYLCLFVGKKPLVNGFISTNNKNMTINADLNLPKKITNFKIKVYYSGLETQENYLTLIPAYKKFSKKTLLASAKSFSPSQITTKSQDKNQNQAQTAWNPPPSNYDHWFTQYEKEYNLSPNKLKKIAYCESHYNPNAVNGPYVGMYQYLTSTWISTRKAMNMDPNPDLRSNPHQAIITTAWKIANGGIGAWPVCGRK